MKDKATSEKSAKEILNKLRSKDTSSQEREKQYERIMREYEEKKEYAKQVQKEKDEQNKREKAEWNERINAALGVDSDDEEEPTQEMPGIQVQSNNATKVRKLASQSCPNLGQYL